MDSTRFFPYGSLLMQNHLFVTSRIRKLRSLLTGCSALMGSEQQLDGDISSYDSLKSKVKAFDLSSLADRYLTWN